MDRANDSTRFSAAFHFAKLDHQFSLVNAPLTSDPLACAQPSGSMGDERHKKSPPPAEEEEDVTDGFRQEVREALEINKKLNRLRRLKKKDSGWLISNRAELADAIGTDITMVNKLIGPARPTSKPVKLADRSTFVHRIREVLQLAAVKAVSVKIQRADDLKFLNEVSDDEWKAVKRYVDEAKRKLEATPRKAT